MGGRRVQRRLLRRHATRLRLAPIGPVIVSVDVDLDGMTWRSGPKPSDPDDDGFIGGPAAGFVAMSQGRLRFLNTLRSEDVRTTTRSSASGISMTMASGSSSTASTSGRCSGGWTLQG
ncbi:hypothetical protein ACP4OV_023701 [Aristida adscensionis]